MCRLNEIIKSGHAYGAQPGDIYGCLYFFLSDQLRTFAKRIRELDVTFHIFNTAATHTLARDISGGQYSRYGLTPSIRFDRIDLAHTLADSEDMRDVLKSWMPLLSPGDTAAIVGVFSDWTSTQKDGSVAGADQAIVAPIVGKLIKLGRVTKFPFVFLYFPGHEPPFTRKFGSCRLERRWKTRWKRKRRSLTQRMTTRKRFLGF